MGKLIHGVDEQAVCDHEQDRSRKVDGNFFRFFTTFLQQLPRQISAPDTDGQIEIKDPAPADRIDQNAAQRRTGQKADVKRHGSKAHRFAALIGGKGDRSDGSAVGRDHRAADGLQAAKQNDLPDRLGCAAKRRTEYENQKSAGVEAAPAEKIAQAADGDHGADKQQIIDQQNPLNGGQARIESMRQRRQGDQQSALIESDDELADANIEQNQRQPSWVGRACCRCFHLFTRAMAAQSSPRSTLILIPAAQCRE